MQRSNKNCRHQRRQAKIAYMPEVFYSRYHPAHTPELWAFRSALSRPLAACLLALGIGLLVLALEAQPLVHWLVVGFPIASLLAIGWTAYWMRQSLAEIHCGDEGVALRSIWEVRWNHPALPQPLYEVRRDTDRTHLALGERLVTLRDSDWPEATRLLEVLLTLRHQTLASLNTDDLLRATPGPTPAAALRTQSITSNASLASSRKSRTL
jgi:hypothetical protein